MPNRLNLPGGYLRSRLMLNSYLSVADTRCPASGIKKEKKPTYEEPAEASHPESVSTTPPGSVSSEQSSVSRNTSSTGFRSGHRLSLVSC